MSEGVRTCWMESGVSQDVPEGVSEGVVGGVRRKSGRVGGSPEIKAWILDIALLTGG